jgi:tetratricopeptide (TPR) repeat protein
MRPAYLVLCCGLVFVVLLVACAVPTPTATPERLPTRAATRMPSATPTPTPFAISAWVYYQDGVTRREAGDMEGALRSFNGALRLNPEFALAYMARGKVHLVRGDPRQALADANTALEIAPKAVEARLLRGEALRRLKRYRLAYEALEQVTTLAPSLGSDTFQARWLSARAERDGARLLALSQEYAAAHPEDGLRGYYRGWALIESAAPLDAVRILVEAIENAADPPALLWFTLAQAYLASHAPEHAVVASETARALVEAGDTSIMIHADQPIVELFGLLGDAYLAAGRCVDATTMLEYAEAIGARRPRFGIALEQARLCLTPTPTATPYPTTTPSRD